MYLPLVVSIRASYQSFQNTPPLSFPGSATLSSIHFILFRKIRIYHQPGFLLNSFINTRYFQCIIKICGTPNPAKLWHYKGCPLALSHTTVVSLWLVMPMAAIFFTVSPALVRLPPHPTGYSISLASCSPIPVSKYLFKLFGQRK